MCHPISLIGVIRDRTIGVKPLEISSLISSMTADPKAGKMGTGDDFTVSNGIN